MDVVNLVVMGKTGAGKSTLINSVLEEDLAPTGSGQAVTRENCVYSRKMLVSVEREALKNIETYKLPYRILSQRSTKNLFVAFEIFLVSIFRLVEKADVHCNLERDLGVRYFMADSFQPLPVLCHKR